MVKLNIVRSGVAPVAEAQGRSDGAGSEVIGIEPSGGEIDVGGFCFWEIILVKFRSEALGFETRGWPGAFARPSFRFLPHGSNWLHLAPEP